jgi:hypothetical protein
MGRVALAVAGALLAGPALAQPACNVSARAYAALTEQHGESRRFVGISGVVIAELWASEDGGWTLLVTKLDGTSCLVASGDAAQFFAATPPGEPG